MKMRITLKDPDGFYEAIRSESSRLGIPEGVAWESIKPWVEFSEYVTLEFDLEEGSARVVRNER
jgi:hypothetical protein